MYKSLIVPTLLLYIYIRNISLTFALLLNFEKSLKLNPGCDIIRGDVI